MAGFGHYPFGHSPFGHSPSTAGITDLALNPLANPSTGQMLGYTEEEITGETFGLNIYDFIIKSIRHEDEQGTLFLKRFLQGPQTVWETNQAKILSIKNLWDPTEIEDEHLAYLKNIVGWTDNLNYITNELSTDRLRRVVDSSVALWKSRGNEDSLMDLLTLATGERMRIWNWFDFRWLSDETILDEDHTGLDSWLVSLPENDPYEEYWSNLRIVDSGDLNKKLVRDIVCLMRAVSERFEITYLYFLDLFETDDDDSQWYDTYQDTATGTPMTVSDGTIALTNDTLSESAIVGSKDAQGWTNYSAYWRVKVSDVGAGVGIANLLFYADDFENGFSIALDVPNDRFSLGSIVAGVSTYTHHAILPSGFVADVYNGVRVVITSVPSTNKVNIALYVNNDELINEDITAAFMAGAVGFGHEANQTITISEVEVMPLPSQSDQVTVNTA